MENEVLNKPDYIKELVGLIRGGMDRSQLAKELANYHDNDISNALDELSSDERKILYHTLGDERISEIFAYLDDPGRYLGELELERAADIIENMDADDAVDVLEEIDEATRRQLIELIDEESKEDIKLICSYEEDEIGSKMTTNFIEIGKSLTIKQAMRSLIAQAEENDNISTLFVKDDDGTFYGAIDLKDLIVARNYMSLENLITHSFPYVRDHETISDCIERLKDYAEDSIPVLNDKNEPIGVITAQDIVEVVDDELGDDYAKLAGMSEEAELEESLAESIKTPAVADRASRAEHVRVDRDKPVRGRHRTACHHRKLSVRDPWHVRQCGHAVPRCHDPAADGRKSRDKAKRSA